MIKCTGLIVKLQCMYSSFCLLISSLAFFKCCSPLFYYHPLYDSFRTSLNRTMLSQYKMFHDGCQQWDGPWWGSKREDWADPWCTPTSTLNSSHMFAGFRTLVLTSLYTCPIPIWRSVLGRVEISGIAIWRFLGPVPTSLRGRWMSHTDLFYGPCGIPPSFWWSKLYKCMFHF